MIFKRFLLLLTVLSSFYLRASSQDFIPNGGSPEERINEQMNAAVGAFQRPNNPSLFSLVSMSQYNPRAVRNAISISHLLTLLSLERYREATPAQIVALSQMHEEIRGILLQELARRIPQDFAERVRGLERNRVLTAYYIALCCVDHIINKPMSQEETRLAVQSYIEPILAYFQSQDSNASSDHLSELISLSWLIHHGYEYRLIIFNKVLSENRQSFDANPLSILSLQVWDRNDYLKLLKSALEGMVKLLDAEISYE